jgi:hypothetical protein
MSGSFGARAQRHLCSNWAMEDKQEVSIGPLNHTDFTLNHFLASHR